MNKHQINAVCKAVLFLEENLQEQVGISEAAEAAGYSLYHFCRMFNRIVRYSPYHYLMKRRLSEAARDLIETDWNISRIAFEYEFNSPETFARAFRKIFKMLPSEWRKKYTDPPAELLMPAFTKQYLRFINSGKIIKPELCDNEEILLCGIMGLDSSEIDLERLLYQEVRDYSAMEKYVVAWKSGNSTEKKQIVFIGFRIERLEDCLPDLVIKKIPATIFWEFHLNIFQEDMRNFKQFLHHTLIPNSNLNFDTSLEIIKYKNNNTLEKSEEISFLIPVTG